MEDLEGPVTSREQDALRILLLLDGACGVLNSAEAADPGLVEAVGWFGAKCGFRSWTSGAESGLSCR